MHAHPSASHHPYARRRSGVMSSSEERSEFHVAQYIGEHHGARSRASLIVVVWTLDIHIHIHIYVVPFFILSTSNADVVM
jgi:hypothetical protein